MRERLTVAFVAVAVLVAAVVILVRAYALSGELRSTRSESLHNQATVVAAAIVERTSAERPVNEAFLQALVAPDVRAVYHRPGEPDLVAAGPDFGGGTVDSSGSDDDLWAVADAPGGRVTLTERGSVVPDFVLGNAASVVGLFLLVALVAGGLGYLVSRRLSDPFRQLAVAAAGLGRGRFQLDLPQTNIPEARSIATALERSSVQLEERLSREQRLAEHASHVLRTPLTSLRLELEDLAQHDELPGETSATIGRCIQRIDQLDAVTGELVSLARHGAIVTGAEIPLRELATQSTQRWADELGAHDRQVVATVEGDLETSYTPGPVEQILDLVLLDVVHRTRGPVQLFFESCVDSHLRMVVSWSGKAAPNPSSGSSGTPLMRARAVAMALGGRLEENASGGSLWVRLPRR